MTFSHIPDIPQEKNTPPLKAMVQGREHRNHEICDSSLLIEAYVVLDAGLADAVIIETCDVQAGNSCT